MGGGGGTWASSLKKKIFSALRASIWSKNKEGPPGPNLNPNAKNKGGGDPSGPSSGSATAIELRTERAIVMSHVTIKVVTSSFEGTRHGSD